MKHIGTPLVYNEILRDKNVRLKMQTHMSLDKGIKNLNLNRKLYRNQQI
jgi:hypothetical protein